MYGNAKFFVVKYVRTNQLTQCVCTYSIYSHNIHELFLIPATPLLGLVLVYLLNVIYDVTVTIKIYLVTQNWTSLRR